VRRGDRDGRGTIDEGRRTKEITSYASVVLVSEASGRLSSIVDSEGGKHGAS
jgi:hypothetical protein